MSEHDLTGVDPMRWPEVRRRIDAVTSFLALAKPRKSDRDAAAASVGLGTKSFMRLVRSWQEHGEARRLETAATKGVRRPRSTNIGEGVRAIVRQAVASAPSDQSLSELVDLVATECARAGENAPSKTTVWNIIRQERLAAPKNLEPAIVVGEAWADIPVMIGGAIMRPSLALAVTVPEGAVIASDIAYGGAPAGLGRLLARLAEGSIDHASPRRLLLPNGKGPKRSTRIADVLGSNVSNLRLVYRARLSTPAERLLRTRLDIPMTVDDATTFIAGAIARHNEQLDPGASRDYRLY